MTKPVIAVTMGDPGGIGPEVIVKAFRVLKPSVKIKYVVIGNLEVFDRLKRLSGLAMPLNFLTSFETKALREDRVNFLNLPMKTPRFVIGGISRINAAMTHEALAAAASLAVGKKIDAIVTAPLNKTALRLIDPGFQGHTEYFAAISKTKDFAMMFVSDRLKVTLVTIHVPLGKVSQEITSKRIETKIRLTDDFLKKRLGLRQPRIGVCALNPHGEETGHEDRSIVTPAVKKMRAWKINVLGPFSADQIFYEAYRGRFDAVVSMYHDQGLGPFKMMAFREGVNVTLGLPFIRTSPDHGTAFDIAYQNKADPGSMLAALKLAGRLLLSTPSKKE